MLTEAQIKNIYNRLDIWTQENSIDVYRKNFLRHISLWINQNAFSRWKEGAREGVNLELKVVGCTLTFSAFEAWQETGKVPRWAIMTDDIFNVFEVFKFTNEPLEFKPYSITDTTVEMSEYTTKRYKKFTRYVIPLTVQHGYSNNFLEILSQIEYRCPVIPCAEIDAIPVKVWLPELSEWKAE